MYVHMFLKNGNRLAMALDSRGVGLNSQLGPGHKVSEYLVLAESERTIAREKDTFREFCLSAFLLWGPTIRFVCVNLAFKSVPIVLCRGRRIPAERGWNHGTRKLIPSTTG